MPRRARLPEDPEKSALFAGLKYVSCSKAGFERKRSGNGFVYLDLDGKPIRDEDTLRRIRAMVLPPAWEKVWICPSPEGHLQATGMDAKGRRQYRYHADYRLVRNHTKFYRMLNFAKALPKIRQRVMRDLRKPGLSREKVLAAVVSLLETTFIRVGNEEYAKENASFGLTTLRNRHVKIAKDTIHFHFRGKSGQMHDVELHDRRLARIVRECRDLPGYDLFQYKDKFGELHALDSSDVNAYLQKISGDTFTAKDYRTWAGTIQTALHLAELGQFTSESAAKKNIVAAIKATATKLGNRPATARKYYVHPAIIDSYLDRSLLETVKPPEQTETELARKLHPEEECVIRLIRKQSVALLDGLVVRAA